MKLIRVLAVVACIAGCTAPFSRPIPTASEYKQRFLAHLEPEQIGALQFSYHGSVGGESSIARFKVNSAAISQIRANTQREDVFGSDDAAASQELMDKIAMCAGEGRIPKWFDFPFDKPLPVFTDSGDFTNEHPAYSHEWYVDEERGVVYFVSVEG